MQVASQTGRGLMMAITSYQISPELRQKVFVERWFFTGMALAMLATSTVGFMPSLMQAAGRREPISPLAAAHGIVFFVWLLIFLVQTSLVASRYVTLHRKLGLASVFVLALMIPLAYTTTVAMVRRGFDLSGDLKIDHDPLYESIFPFSNILIFSVLALAALAYRRRPEIHKRLMLFANIELMPAPLAHLIGHTPRLASLPAAIIMIPISMFVIAAVAREALLAKRAHPSHAGWHFCVFSPARLRPVLLVRAQHGTNLRTGSVGSVLCAAMILIVVPRQNHSDGIMPNIWHNSEISALFIRPGKESDGASHPFPQARVGPRAIRSLLRAARGADSRSRGSASGACPCRPADRV